MNVQKLGKVVVLGIGFTLALSSAAFLASRRKTSLDVIEGDVIA